MRPASTRFVAFATLAAFASSASASGSKDVIVQMFQWSWDSIAAECTAFLGAAGYGYVQTSPPQETITGTQWWTDYQPVSYNLTGKHGSRAQFANMVKTCHRAGVKVLVDGVWNHMTGATAPGVGTAGDAYTKYSYPPTYTTDDFHMCGHDTSNWGNQTEAWECELDGLADLYTEKEHVRSTLAAYGDDLMSLGADGFRLDAAKSINPADLMNITTRLKRKPSYITQEVIWGAGDAVTPDMYLGIGAVQEFRYPALLQTAFLNDEASLQSLQNLSMLGWVPSASANVFVANHDLERTGPSLNYESPWNTYLNAMIFSLGYPYGTPTILSSYNFSSYDVGAPNDGYGTCAGSGGANGWLCQHRIGAVARMTAFHNIVGSAPLTHWVSPTPKQIAFGRGALGFLAINNADAPWIATFQTALLPGTYCDVVSGALKSVVKCAGSSYTVSWRGTFSVTIPERTSIALHLGEMILGPSSTVPAPTPTWAPAPSAVAVTFAPTVTTVYGENVFVTGNLPQLGNWTPNISVALSSTNYPVWNGSISLPPGIAFQYKYVKQEADGSFSWESDPNRSATTSETADTQVLHDTWQGAPTSTSAAPAPTATATVNVTFAATVATVQGEHVVVTGSLAQLGTWSPTAGITLSAGSSSAWNATVALPAGTAFQYKYIKLEADGTIVWESDPNRSDTTPSSGTQTLTDAWQA